MTSSNFVISGGIKIEEVLYDQDFFIFKVSYGSLVIDMQAFKTLQNNTLYLKKIDIFIQGGNTGISPSMITHLGQAFCKKYGAKTVVFEGGKRTTGRSKGKYPNPITIHL